MPGICLNNRSDFCAYPILIKQSSLTRLVFSDRASDDWRQLSEQNDVNPIQFNGVSGLNTAYFALCGSFVTYLVLIGLTMKSGMSHDD